MKGKSFMTFSRGVVRANARRQALSGLFGDASPASPARIAAADVAGLEVRIEPFQATGRPLTDLKPEEIEIRVEGVPVRVESFDRRLVAGKARNVVALLEEEGGAWAGLETRLAPSFLRMGETYQDLRAAEKRQMAIDLVAGGPEARSAQEAAGLRLLTFAGRVTGQAGSSPWRMRFEPSWPAALATRGLDLYNVMLAPPGPGRKGQVLVCEQREGVAVNGERKGLEVSLEGEGERVWGILAVDPETGRGWVRRLTFKVPCMKTRDHS